MGLQPLRFVGFVEKTAGALQNLDQEERLAKKVTEGPGLRTCCLFEAVVEV